MDLTKLFSSLRTTVGDAAKRVQSLHDEAELERRKRDQVQSARANRDDLLQAVNGWVDRAGESFASRFGVNVRELVQRPALLQGPLRVDELLPGALVGNGSAADLAGALCAMNAPAVKAAFAAQIAALPIDNEGLPNAKREAEVARLSARVAELEAEADRIVQEAAEAGVTLQINHLR